MPSVVTLQRANLTEPWGFRLQGGLDFRMPLNIKKIYPGTSASGSSLGLGDAIVRINDTDTTKLTHLQAATIFRTAGTQVDLGVEKGVYRPLPSHSGRLKFSPSTAQSQQKVQKVQTQSYTTPGTSYIQKTTTTTYSSYDAAGGPSGARQVTQVTSRGPPPAAYSPQQVQVGFSDY